MANVLDNLAADIYVAAEKVGRELVGGATSVRINGGAQEAAKGDIVRSAFTRPVTASTSYAPAMTIPEGTDQTVDNKTMTLDTYASVQIPYTGEEQKHLDNGAGYQTVYGNQIQQAMRSICNKIELDLMGHLGANAGIAFGTAGTTPFGSNINDLPEIMKLLLDRGCPDDGMISGIYDTAAAVKIQQLANLYKVNEAGDNGLLRRGELGQLYNVMLKRSAQVARPAVGTGSGYLINNSGGYAIGAKTLVLDTGTGTILAGDVVTIGNFKYVVAVALASNQITLQSGLLEAVADNAQVNVNAQSRRNIVLHRDAAELAMRPLANPYGGDAAVDRIVVNDPVSGLSFTVSMYRGFHKCMIEIACLYGYKLWLPDFAAVHLG